MTKSIIKYILLTLFIFGVISSYVFWRKEDAIPPNKSITVLKLYSKNTPYYIVTKFWGVAGNHEEIFLSRSAKQFPNKAEDYIFYSTEVFYKVLNDTSIILYAPESNISEPVVSWCNVSIIGLNNKSEIDDYNLNYKKYGLQKISVYNNVNN